MGWGWGCLASSVSHIVLEPPTHLGLLISPNLVTMSTRDYTDSESDEEGATPSRPYDLSGASTPRDMSPSQSSPTRPSASDHPVRITVSRADPSSSLVPRPSPLAPRLLASRHPLSPGHDLAPSPITPLSTPSPPRPSSTPPPPLPSHPNASSALVSPTSTNHRPTGPPAAPPHRASRSSWG